MAFFNNRAKDTEFDNWLKDTGSWIRTQELATIPPVSELRDMFSDTDGRTVSINDTARLAGRLVRRDAFFRRIKTAAVSIIILFVVNFAMLMTVSSDARAAVRTFFIEWFDRYIRVTPADISGETESVAPRDFRPTYMPEGFAESVFHESDEMLWLIYENDGEAVIELIIQIFTGAFAAGNEYRDFFVRVIDGVEYRFFEAVDTRLNNIIFWYYEGLLFEVMSRGIPIDELESIALSVERQ